MEISSESVETLIRQRVQRFDKSCKPKVLFQNLYDRGLKLGLTPQDLCSLRSVAELKIQSDISYGPVLTWLKKALFFMSLFLLFIGIVYVMDWPVNRETIVSTTASLLDVDMNDEKCLLSIPEYIEIPVTQCGFCKNVTQVDRVTNISVEEFKKYAYSGRPVIITDATRNWTAPQVFSYDFFKSLYVGNEDSQTLDNDECEFFPYNSKFENLKEVFSMDDSQAKLASGTETWYVGWQNCDHVAGAVLRKYYQRPYFLPKDSESSHTDWLHMGSAGRGALLHIDRVKNPSWQAQITGTKVWTFVAPSDCYFECNGAKFDGTVNSGDIIVVNANLWYHSTKNIGKGIHISITSEFD